MVIKLNIQERLILLSILPSEGNFSELFFSKQISNEIAISSEENDKYGIRSTTTDEGVSITWNALAITDENDFHLSEEHIVMLNTIFTKMNDDKKLNMSNFSTAAKIFDAAKELNI